MPKLTFSGHDTFPLRFSWLPKGLRELEKDSDVFFKDDAIVKLGVGKNMVRAIRHWCCALNMAEVDGRKGIGKVTKKGRNIFLNPGWDPYLEDPGTLWLLQWFLASRRDKASTWYLAFTKWNADLFRKNELIDWLHGIVQELEGSRATRNSLKRDVDVFIRTYVPSDPSPYRPLEDTFDSPLVELGLIREEDGLYRFVKGEKPSLPQAVFSYALIDYWNSINEKLEKDLATLSFEKILYDPSSPGRAFQLSERALANRLEKLPKEAGLYFDETSGLRNLLRTEKELPEPMSLLKNYYENDEVKLST